MCPTLPTARAFGRTAAICSEQTIINQRFPRLSSCHSPRLDSLSILDLTDFCGLWSQMLKSRNLKNTPITLRFLRLGRNRVTILVYILLANLHFATVSAQEASHVLILHEFWEQDNWAREIDRSFFDSLKATLGIQTRISAQYLGIREIQSSDSLERKRQHIEDMIRDQSVDLVVTVLPAAGDFYLKMENRFDVPVIFLLPGFESLPEGISSNPLVIVRNEWGKAIGNTLEDMLALRPRTQTIEVFVGNNALDRVYGDRVKQVARNFAGRVNFSFQEGFGPDRLRSYTQQLGEESLVLTLPNSAYGADQKEGELSFLRDLFDLSPVPVFGFSAVNLQVGIVGGNLTPTQNYGITTAAVAYSILSGEPDYLSVSELATESIYNWPLVDYWDLDLERLDSPYQLLSQPSTFWQEYPTIVISALNVLLLLCGALVFQSLSLRRSKLAHAQLTKSESQLRESEAQYRLLASNSKDVIWTWNIATNSISYCSPSIQSLLGYTSEELMTFPLAKVMTAESIKIAEAAFSDSSSEAQVFEIEYLTKQGSSVCCEIVAQVSLSDSGEPLEWVGVSRDISQRKAAESERQKLEHQVQQAQKFESIGTLAGGIAHDFNNILGVVTGITDLLKIEMANQSKASELLNKLMTAADKAKSLVSQILTFSRQSSGEKVVTDLPQLIEESLSILQAGIPKTCVLKKHIATGSLKVMADPTHIEQVILNLITNAAEASEHSDGVITISVDTHHFETEKEFPYGRTLAGDYAMLEVKDTGVGMDLAHLNKIFEPFYTSKALGNGMGMAIVHGIVMDHMGAIDIQSRLGEGTTVSVYLPLTDREVADMVEPAAVSEGPRTSSRIMVIDDQEDLLEVTSLMLKNLGHDCVLFSNPRNALRSLKLESDDLDLIITDYSMPDLSGLDVIDYCAENHPSIPVILTTGYGNRITEQLSEDSKDFNVLNKPFNFVELQTALREVLQGKLG